MCYMRPRTPSAGSGAGYGQRAFNALVTLFICGELLSAVFTGMYVGGEIFTTVMQAPCSRGVTSVAAVA